MAATDLLPMATQGVRRRVTRLMRTAYHEAGHAVLNAAINDCPRWVSIRSDGEYFGHSVAERAREPEVRIQIDLAGRAAEHLLTGCRPRAFKGDLAGVLLAVLYTGRQEAGIHRDEQNAVEAVLEMGCERDGVAIRKEIDRFYEISRASLATIWPAVDVVARALLEEKELDRDGLDRALVGYDIWSPVFAIQRQYGLELLETPSRDSAS